VSCSAALQLLTATEIHKSSRVKNIYDASGSMHLTIDAKKLSTAVCGFTFSSTFKPQNGSQERVLDKLLIFVALSKISKPKQIA
jgi:hypothetical protein